MINPPQTGPADQATEGPPRGSDAPFRPLFVVGCERSGTTLLANLLGRHRDISIPPETGYCWHLARTPPADARSVPGVLKWAGTIPRFSDLAVPPAELAARANELAEPRQGQDQDPRAVVLRAMLECFAARHRSMSAPRRIIGEKSPVHLFSHPVLREWFPAARFLCVVRDGRDVVASLAKVPWTRGESSEMHARQWRLCMRVTHQMQRAVGADALVLRYEELLTEPEATLTRACAFAGVDFDPSMLDPSEPDTAVPAWEAGWKEKATGQLDPSRAYAWRRTMDPHRAAWLSLLMRPELERSGYVAGPRVPPLRGAIMRARATLQAPMWDVRVIRRRTGARSLRAAQNL